MNQSNEQVVALAKKIRLMWVNGDDSATDMAEFILSREASLQSENVRLQDGMDAWRTTAESLQKSIAEVRAAIKDEGPEPYYHHEVMARHRRQWPRLWKALDKLLPKDADGGKGKSL